MKLNLILPFVFTLFVCSVSAQNQFTDTSTTIVTYWKKGETNIFDISNSKEKYQDGKLSSKGGSNYEAHVKILEETDKSYTIQWTYKNITTSKDENPIVASMAKMSEGLQVIYKTDELGAFSELVNWEEMRDYLNRSIDKMLKQFDNNPQVAAVFNQVKGAFQTKEALEQLMIKDIQLYHSPYGAEYNLNEKLSVDMALPNMLGGDPFPAILTIELTELNPSKDNCILTTTQSVDKEKGSEIIYAFVNQMATALGKPIPEGEELPAFEITDFNQHTCMLSSGLSTKAFHKRVTENNHIRQVETIEITVKK